MKNTFVKVILILVILILLVGIGCYTFFESDLFKSDKELFYKYLGRKNLAALNDYNLEPYKMLSTDNKNYELSGEVILDSLKKSLNITDELSLKISSNFDAKNNKSSSAYMVEYGGEDLLGIDYLRNGEIYALKSDEITDKKYIAIENNNLKELAQKMGVTDTTSIPNKIETISKENNDIDLEKLNKIKDKYVTIIDEKIPEYKYITEKEITINVAEEEINTTRYSLKIREKEIYDIVHNILETLKADDETLQFYIEYTGNNSLTIKDLKNNIRDTIKKLESNKNNFSETDNITISVYAYKGKTIRTEILDIDGNGIIFTINTRNKNEQLEIETITNKNEDKEIYVGNTTTIKLYNNAKKDKIELNINISTVYNKNDIVSLEESTSLIFVDEDSYKDVESKINFIASEEKNNVKISCIGTESEEQMFSFEGELEKEKNVSIDDLTEENSTILNNSTETEINTLMDNISSKAIRVVLQKASVIFPSIVNFVGNKVDNFSDNETEEITTDFVKSDLNIALTNVLDEYVSAATLLGEPVDSAEYINENKIKEYCTRATEIILTDTTIQYVADNGKTYEGVITTDMTTGYFVVEEIIEK